MKEKRLVYKIAACGIYSALALIAFVIENLFPPLFLPSARIGVSNLFILLAAITLGTKYGAAVLIIKCVLGNVFSGNLSAVIYSLPAGIAAYAAEITTLRFFKGTTVTAASALGAVVSSVCQNAVFCSITGSSEYFAYLPYLALTGLAGGLTVGIAATLILRILPESFVGGGIYGNLYKIYKGEKR